MQHLGPVQQLVLDSAKEYYHLTHKLITICDIVEYTHMKHSTVKKALDTLSRKGKLRRLSPRSGYALLV